MLGLPLLASQIGLLGEVGHVRIACSARSCASYVCQHWGRHLGLMYPEGESVIDLKSTAMASERYGWRWRLSLRAKKGPGAVC